MLASHRAHADCGYVAAVIYELTQYENREVLSELLKDRQIYPQQLCPLFVGQASSLVPIYEGCYFCQFGAFHKKE